MYCELRRYVCEVDPVDTAIVEALTRDARASYRALGATVGLSANAAAARVRKLEDAGVIRGYTVVRGDGPSRARGGLEVYVDVRLEVGVDSVEFGARIRELPQVLEASHMTGAFDVLLRAHVADTDALDALLRRLKGECGATQTVTRVIMSAVKEPAQ